MIRMQEGGRYLYIGWMSFEVEGRKISDEDFLLAWLGTAVLHVKKNSDF